MRTPITLADYFGQYKNHPAAQAVVIIRHATLLLAAVNEYLGLAESDGVEIEEDPLTGNDISGTGNGGFRPPDCPVGSPLSSHKDGRGLDHKDVARDLTKWALTDGRVHAERLGLYFEHPQWTRSWLHSQIGAPLSGARFYVPYTDMVKNPPTCAPLAEFAAAGVKVFPFIAPTVIASGRGSTRRT